MTLDEIKIDTRFKSDLLKAGSIPGEGAYRCVNCSVKWLLEDHEDLPECPDCNGIEFEREDEGQFY